MKVAQRARVEGHPARSGAAASPRNAGISPVVMGGGDASMEQRSRLGWVTLLKNIKVELDANVKYRLLSRFCDNIRNIQFKHDHIHTTSTDDLHSHPQPGQWGVVSPLNSIRAAPHPPVGTSLAT